MNRYRVTYFVGNDKIGSADVRAASPKEAYIGTFGSALNGRALTLSLKKDRPLTWKCEPLDLKSPEGEQPRK